MPVYKLTTTLQRYVFIEASNQHEAFTIAARRYPLPVDPNEWNIRHHLDVDCGADKSEDDNA